MRYWTHLITLDSSGTHVLVRRSRAGWLLPYFTLEHRGRVSLEVKDRLAKCGLAVVLIHEARIPADSTPDDSTEVDVHWYALAQATGEGSVHDDLQLASIDDLAPGAAVLPVQHRGLRLALDRFTNPVAPFDSRAGVDRVHQWVADHVAAAGRTSTHPPILFRFQRYTRVVAYPTDGRSAYYKGGSPAIDAEARLTQALHGLAPECFAGTLAYEPAGDWLQNAVTGRFLPPKELTVSHAEAIGRTLAQIQQKAAASDAVRTALDGRNIDESRLVQAVGRVARLVQQRSPETIDGLPSFAEQIEETVSASYRRLLALDLPSTWIHADLWFPNALFDADKVTFIDLENGFYGPAPLPLWRLGATFVEHATDGSRLDAAATDAFVESWRDLCAAATMRAGLLELPVVGRAFYQLLLLERLERHALEEDRPEFDVTASAVLGAVSHELYKLAVAPACH